MPAVSTNHHHSSLILTSSSTGSTVVPATLSTTTRSLPARAFSSEDLPTFGLPSSATRRGPASRPIPEPSSGRIATAASSRSPAPRPCSAETVCGSPSPSDHSDWASSSVFSSSALFATRRTGLPALRRTWTTASSVSVAPTFASTMNITASASLTARSAWAAMAAAMPRTLRSQPPVSMRMKRLPFHSASYMTRSRVTPGTSSTTASRRPIMRLTSVDLPTLGRPTTARTGRPECSPPGRMSSPSSASMSPNSARAAASAAAIAASSPTSSPSSSPAASVEVGRLDVFAIGVERHPLVTHRLHPSGRCRAVVWTRSCPAASHPGEFLGIAHRAAAPAP